MGTLSSTTNKQTWYVIRRYGGSKITPITVLRETDKTLIVEEEKSWPKPHVEERRRFKDSDTWRTKEEAEAEITRRLTRDVQSAEEELIRAKAALEKWQFGK